MSSSTSYQRFGISVFALGRLAFSLLLLGILTLVGCRGSDSSTQEAEGEKQNELSTANIENRYPPGSERNLIIQSCKQNILASCKKIEVKSFSPVQFRCDYPWTERKIDANEAPIEDACGRLTKDEFKELKTIVEVGNPKGKYPVQAGGVMSNIEKFGLPENRCVITVTYPAACPVNNDVCVNYVCQSKCQVPCAKNNDTL